MMQIAVSGLGRMGMQIAQKLSEAHFEVVAHNRSPEKVKEAAAFGASPAYTKEDVAASFQGQQAVIWLMVPAEIVESELRDWLAILPKGSIFIDGGNSDYRNTVKHAEFVKNAGSTLIDSGTSGGIWGYRRGFSMMIGGDEKVFALIQPVFTVLALPSGGQQHFGPSGSGHYVKMVHNAIEYGMMESLAEGYRMLKEGPYSNLSLEAAGDVWQKNSVITSWLNELTRDAIKENPTLDTISGRVQESGEARWTIETAKDLGISLPAIEASLDVRLASQTGTVNFSTKLLSAMRNKFGGHAIK